MGAERRTGQPLSLLEMGGPERDRGMDGGGRKEERRDLRERTNFKVGT